MDDKGNIEQQISEQNVCSLSLLTDKEEDEGKKQVRSIEDPWHSKILDVHRWSEHPELVRVVSEVWQAHFPDLEQHERSGPKPKQSFRYQLRVLVLDLYVAWLEDPELCIAVSMSQNDWKTCSRYNALRISKKIILLIQRLADVGLIDLSRGSYGGPWAPYNRTTRIRAAGPLRELFRGAKAQRDDVHQVVEQECIILRAGDGEKAKLVDYEDTDETNRMRRELRAYNLMLADTFIDIPTLDEPWVERTVAYGRPVKVQIDHHHHFVRRIFSRGEWSSNGRFYGPWWQQVDKKLRSQIFINDTPTVEVDFKGLHVAILSAERGVAMEGDPYALPNGLVPGAPPELQRTIIKKLVLTALNARSKKAAFGSFREGFSAGHMAKTLKDKELERLLDAFTNKHPHLRDCLCTDQGIRLMNLDGRIAEIVHRFLTRRGIPVLSVHDSFIIDYTHVRELKGAMATAARVVVGKPLAVDANGPGLDEMARDTDHDVVLDFEWWRETGRTPRYLERLRRWEERKRREVIPYNTRKKLDTAGAG